MKRNDLDVAWERYLKSKNKSDFKQIIDFVKQLPDPITEIFGSLYFGEIMSQLTFAFKSFMCGNERQLRKLTSVLGKLSNTQKTAMAEFLYLILNVREVFVNELTLSDLNMLSAQSGVISKKLLETFEVFDLTDEQKLNLLEEKSLPNIFSSESYFKVAGTSVFDACFIRVLGDGGKAYIISLQSPIDAIFIPASGLIIKSDHCKFEIASRAKKLISAALRNQTFFCDSWVSDRQCNVVNLIRDRRPYHVLADELSANFYLRYKLGKKYPIVSLERSSFFEKELFNYTPLSLDEVQNFGSDKVLFSAYRRLDDKSSWSDDYRHWLINKAIKLYGRRLFTKSKGQICIWIGIAGGEKRVWKEELEGLVAVVKWFKNKFSSCFFIFDGWTGTENLTETDIVNIEEHNLILRQIVERSGVDKNEFKSTVGSQVLKKIAFASQCDFFIACAGTPALWPSNICRVPGVVHNSTQMINRVDNTMNVSNVVKIPVEMITDIREDMNKDRWDFVSYSISPEVVVKSCEEAVLKYL